MISTTLMTFLLITKPEVRSVKLLGSWDNFSKQYVMERDTRAGPGHWKGCHTFTDMIGDGPDKTQWRTGGLKMGGTYWYYYLLDGDIEYYNEAEPTTTMCPLLPGQPMNVLNVPIILPDSRAHGRSASGSSQKSDNLRTMNPEDKFMNPRKPPPQPQPVRLQTSATVRHEASPAHSESRSPMAGIHRSVSQPHSAARKGHKKDSRSMSPPRARALLAAFRQPAEADRKLEPVQQVNPSKIVPQQKEVVEHRRNIPGIKVNAGIAIPSSSSSDKPGPSTIQSRRAMKATPGESTPGRLLTVQTRPEAHKPCPSRSANGNTAEFDENRAIREGLKDIASSSELPTPTAGFTKEKRLPTLPNTPSSVMDEAVRAIDERDKAMDGEIPRSYFSSMTATTIDTTHSRFVPEYSRFSEWSTDTENDYNPHESMTSTSASDQHQDESSAERWRTPDLSQSGDGATNTDPNTPHLTVYSKPSSPNSASGELPPWSVNLPELTVSLSTPDIDCSGLGIENMDEVESNPKRHAALFSALESMEALAMSRSPIGSPILLPQVPRGSDTEQGISSVERKVSETSLERIRSRRSNASFQGNATMEELMDELSYLKNLIQADMDGAPF
ncbi:unnamed protein product [Penicillium nalgiovense]|uniref:AMP-activated protein kinase glycogen-binding domain-containing protein n=1 Tax=Penicillium nalgiovense TaxID=60175 RepID=A0A1V6YMS9_PENNA|nr:hypothetical protein PENNAL_c0016G03161 [Penicillium nalgiovense]CAG7942533.1 unnamed protein product [Penicillium nalgiovense]CAG7966950.1 unnamed protein product [Penicillium nalgiovense]CAG7979599.1 unnamed protein product [Penicillium nalgiovense]CAG7991972.1 unnamed protein product [Penicillium nalgiovense]